MSARRTKSQIAKRGQERVFRVNLKHDGPSPGSFLVMGDGDSTGFRVRYYVAGSDITSEVTKGRYLVADLPPDVPHIISVHITPEPCVSAGASKTCSVISMSAIDESHLVEVQAVVTVCPDSSGDDWDGE